MTAVTPTRASTRSISEILNEARERTLLLVHSLSDADLTRQHDPLMSPIVWDLGHIAHFEELWLTRNLDGKVEFGEMPGVFNPFEHPRRTRGALSLPTRAECLAILADVRRRVLGKLETVDLDSDNPLLHDAYVYRMVVQHEYQHNETILQTLQLKKGAPYRPVRRWPVPVGGRTLRSGGMVLFPGGEVSIGTEDRSAAYDNERPRHAVKLNSFRIDVAPVSNADFLEFIEAGGYQDRRYWSDTGWIWKGESAAEAPKYWYREGGEWWSRAMDQAAPVAPTHPVCHVCYYEAEAYARFAGKRLPTELEWEVAASWDPRSSAPRLYPWGDESPTAALANVDQLAFGTAAIGTYPRNVSPLGCYGMIGDVWEWTSTNFTGYPGYESFPYRDYSEVFFGSEYKVLRGGSWATRPGAIRNTFRNWDYPIRRQIFCGFRCAANA